MKRFENIAEFLGAEPRTLRGKECKISGYPEKVAYNRDEVPIRPLIITEHLGGRRESYRKREGKKKYRAPKYTLSYNKEYVAPKLKPEALHSDEKFTFRKAYKQEEFDESGVKKISWNIRYATRWTDVEWLIAYRMMKNDFSKEEIAISLERTDNSVYQKTAYMIRKNWEEPSELSRHYKSWKPEEETVILQMRKQGYAFKKIAIALGRKAAAVQQHFYNM